MQSLLILGRQPAIGLAELESLYGPDKIQPLAAGAALVDVDPCLLAFDRLGGSIKFCKVLTRLDTNDWKSIEQFLIEVSPGHSESMPAGKMLLGISAYGYNISPKQIQSSAISIKQAIRRQTGRSVRVVPNNENQLNSAQIIHNKLTSPNGWELIIVKDGAKTVIAQTIKVQDIDAYAKRDQARPARDSKVGMLPPKLAQIIINLAAGKLPPDATQSICEIPPDQPIPAKYFENSLLLDPFCGTGVILQEAMIMGYDCLGSDLEPRMIDYSQRNLDWLKTVPRSPLRGKAKFSLETADATNHLWSKTPTFIASEGYLGRPLSTVPAPGLLQEIITDCDRIASGFLENISRQIKPGTRLCLALPCWRINNKDFRRLPFLDSLERIGYNRVSFQHSGVKDLIYYRSNQLVARELLVIIRK